MPITLCTAGTRHAARFDTLPAKRPARVLAEPRLARACRHRNQQMNPYAGSLAGSRNGSEGSGEHRDFRGAWIGELSREAPV